MTVLVQKTLRNIINGLGDKVQICHFKAASEKHEAEQNMLSRHAH